MIRAALLAAALTSAPPVDVSIPQVLADLGAYQGRRVRVRGFFIADPLLPNVGRLCPADALHLASDCLAVDLVQRIDGAAGARLEVTGVFDGSCRRGGACIDFAADLKADVVRPLS